MTSPRTTLTLGPLLFNWPSGKRRDFYARIADEAPVDTVHIGEVVCSKRMPFIDGDLPDIAERLERGGKTVIWSTLALVMTQTDMDSVRALAGAPDLMVEVNDSAGLSLLAGRQFTIGPMLGIYNEGSLEYVASLGAETVCLPPDLNQEAITTLAASGHTKIEVLAFGRLPLAISARCYHARAHGLHKDGCQFVCGQDMDGMDVDTMDGQPFLTVNGLQTLSGSAINLISVVPELVSAGISSLRLQPHNVDMVTISRHFRDVLDGRRAPCDTAAEIAKSISDMGIANGFYKGIEGYRLAE